MCLLLGFPDIQTISSLQAKAAALSVPASVKPSDLHEDDLAMEIEDEYDPMIPNSYELVLKERRAEREKEREEEVLYSLSLNWEISWGS